jgi:hypothetical protein
MIDSAPMPRLLIVGAIAVAVLAGCGGDDDGAASAREVAQSYANAQTSSDFEQVCDLFSDELRQQFGGDDCSRFLEEQSSGLPRRQFRLTSVDEQGDRATATLVTPGESGEPVQLQISLQREDGDWRVSGIGEGPSA